MSVENRRKKQIKSHLSARLGIPLEVFWFDVTDSTSTEARRYALSGGSVPALFIANAQSAGRGRMGRSFYSPKDTGLYISLLLDIPEEDTVKVTTSAAVAVRRAVLRELGVELKIKWVNDLYLSDKKVSGILCESVAVADRRLTVIGIGINLNTDFLSTELRDIAGSVGVSRDIRPRLVKGLIEEIYRALFEDSASSVADEYRSNSCVIGRPVTFTENGATYSGVAVDITEKGHLIVRLDGNTEKTLSSGEISLRIKDNGDF